MLWRLIKRKMNDNERIIENLTDANCDKAFIEKFMNTSETSERLTMLEKHRKILLDIYHNTIKRLDCLDYLIYNIKKKKLIYGGQQNDEF